MTAIPPSGTDQLDGLVPMLGESVRFDLYDNNDNLLGILAVERSPSPPRISNDTGRTIRRQLDGVRVPARPIADQDATRYYAEDIDPLTMRVRPRWLLATGAEYPLGVFRWGDDSTTVWSWGEPRQGILLDDTLIIDQPLDTNIGYGAGTHIDSALADQVNQAGIDAAHRSIETTTRTLSEPIAWVAGRDHRLRVLESLCSLAGYLPPYFDNNGILVCRSAPDLASAMPTFVYGFGVGRVVPGTPVRSSDILTAPNRYIVIDTAAIDAALVGAFDVPDTAPNSFLNRGFHVVRTIELQGLTDQVAADAAAAAAYASDSTTYSWLSFTTPFDPRHDTFDILSFDGVNYRQVAWSVELRPGGQMQHECRGTYSA